jgi:hypothetical protein
MQEAELYSVVTKELAQIDVAILKTLVDILHHDCQLM